MGTSELQGKLWGAEAQDWTDLFEPMGKPLWLAMLESTQVQEGTKFLDLGCGGGGACIIASQRGASITGLDASSALIGIASKRLPDGRFVIGDLEALPFDDDAFDVAFAANSIMFTSDPKRALVEMRRVTSPGGRVAVGVWGKPEDCDYRHVLKAVADSLPHPPQGKGPFALSETGVLETIFRAADLSVVESNEVSVPFEFEDFDILWRNVNSAGPVQAAKRQVGEEKLKEAVYQASRPFVRSSGSILFNNSMRYVTAKP